MKVGITTFGCDLKSGMSRYASNLIAQFSRISGADSFDVMAHGSASSEYLAEVKGGNVASVSIPEWLANPLLNVAWHQTALPALAHLRDYDALFYPQLAEEPHYGCHAP